MRNRARVKSGGAIRYLARLCGPIRRLAGTPRLLYGRTVLALHSWAIDAPRRSSWEIMGDHGRSWKAMEGERQAAEETEICFWELRSASLLRDRRAEEDVNLGAQPLLELVDALDHVLESGVAAGIEPLVDGVEAKRLAERLARQPRENV